MLRAMRSKKRIWMIGGVVLFAASVLGGAALVGVLPGQAGTLYEDPHGRFSLNVDPSWERVATDGDYAQYRMPDPPFNVYLLALEASGIEDAFVQAFETVGFDTALLANGDTAAFEDWHLYLNQDAEGLTYGLAGQIVGENAFVFMLKSEEPGLSPENAAIFRVLASVKIAGKEELVVGSLAELEALVRQRVDSSAGSISIALVQQGQIVYTYAYGAANPTAGVPADTETIYQLGSMTKLFTATGLMQLVEQGRVSLDAWPGDYVPEFPAAWRVTVRQLLDHSACLAQNDRLVTGQIALGREPFPPLEEVFSAYVQDFPDLACEPGRVAQYSNPHYLALARIIEEVSGEPFETYIQEHLLTPLDMDATSFQLVATDERLAKGQLPAAEAEALLARLNEYLGLSRESLILNPGENHTTLADYRVLPPWGGLRSTPSDITHFLQMHLAGGRYGEAQVLQPETVAAMQQVQTADDGSDLGWALGWVPGENAAGPYRHHSGSVEGMVGTMRIYPALDLGVAVMGNAEGYRPEEIASGVVSGWLAESK